MEEKPYIIDFEKLKPRVKGIRLNIGSGDNNLEGYVNVDRYNPNAEAPWDAGHIPLNDCSVAMIVCFQTIEHFGRHEILSIAKEWYRVCKHGGEVHVTTPDIVASCKMIVDDPKRQWLLARIFGNQSHEGQYHKWGYVTSELSNIFGMAGFASVTVANYINTDESLYIYLKAIR